MRFENLKGQKFNNLTVIERVENYKGRVCWKCLCDCGNYHNVTSYHLKSGEVKSCGCLNHKEKHGMNKTRIHKIWIAMKQRCLNKNHTNYNKYKDKIICNEWVEKENGFINFYNWSIKNNYNDKLTLDRIDNSKGYNPENCRWTTKTVQTLNRDITKTNTSGCIGVRKLCNNKGWYAGITINTKYIHLGSYKSFDDAVKVRKEAELKYHKPLLE